MRFLFAMTQRRAARPELMKLETLTTVEPEFIRVTVRGQHLVEEMLEFIEHVWAESRAVGRSRALMDCRGLEGELTEADRFLGGKRIAELFGSSLKAVCLMPAGQVTKLGELTAVNRGARFLATESETEAIEWLLAP